MVTPTQLAAVEVAFASLVTDCRASLTMTGAKPEMGMYGHFQQFVATIFPVLAPAQTSQTGQWGFLQQAQSDQGVPDYRVEFGTVLRGWVELKAVVGKDLHTLTGHDKSQWERFSTGLQNVLFTNGWQWQLVQNGNKVGALVTMGSDSLFDPAGLPHAPATSQLDGLAVTIQQFLALEPLTFTKPTTAVEALAARAKALKLALLEIGRVDAGPSLQAMEIDFKQLLYRHGQKFTWERFVDAYVQIAVFGVLLWRLESGQKIAMSSQVGLKQGLHPLLTQTLAILWNPAGRHPMLDPLLEELANTVNAIHPTLFTASPHTTGVYVPDPIVHAYEPFFAAYDSASRDEKGVFYTPFPLVRQIISGVDHVLSTTLGRPAGLLDNDALFLDPATGTGTFLLGLADAVAAKASILGVAPDTAVEEVLTRRTAAFELFPGPYTIAHQRVEVALASHNVTPTKRLPIYLADTLAAPESGQLPLSSFGALGAEIVAERDEADAIKTAQNILVILGNPPYERLAEKSAIEPFSRILFDILKENTPLDMRSDLKSSSDLYVAFWLWSLWALQSPSVRQATSSIPTITPKDCQGVIAFVTNRTWLVGNSLAGLRSLIRQGAQEIWVLDLGGDNRGAHGAKSFNSGDANVFDIQTGVAVAWVVFDRDPNRTGPPTVFYQRRYGNKGAKLEYLEQPFDPSDYVQVTQTGSPTTALLPILWADTKLASAPSINEWFTEDPETGPQTARDTSEATPLGVDRADVYAVVSARRTKQLFGSLGRWAKLPATQRQKRWATAQQRRQANAIAPDPASLTTQKLRTYWYRPLDHRTLYDDPAWITWDRPSLRKAFPMIDTDNWAIVTLPHDHGRGPAAIHAGGMPDQHYFRGSAGGRAVYPLWWKVGDGSAPDPRRDQNGRRAGCSDMVIDWLDSLNRTGQFTDAYDYLLAVTTAPGYTERNWRALEVDSLRVPMTDDVAKFDAGAQLGAAIRAAWSRSANPFPGLQWHAAPVATPTGGSLPYGKATFGGQTIIFQNGRKLTGVPDAAWTFEVSGYRVLPEYLRARKHWTDTMARQLEINATIAAIAALHNLGAQADTYLSTL